MGEYRFGPFLLSERTRLLVRVMPGGAAPEAIPLIPRYFDLLALLVAKRNEAVSRAAIMDGVWSDVVVSEGALSQAIRTLRRSLEDDPREPRFIRTVSRYGYQFVCAVEECAPGAADVDGERSVPPVPALAEVAGETDDDVVERDLCQLLGPVSNGSEGDPRLDAAARLHALGSEVVLRRLGTRPGHEQARALLREARWDVPGAGPVPLWGQPGTARATAHLILLRLRRLCRELESRFAGAAAGGALAGLLAGAVGGLILAFGPGAVATPSVALVLALLGAAVGGAGAAGVGFGLLSAEAVFRSARSVMLVPLGALGGAVVGASAHVVALAVLEDLFGHAPSPLGGGLEGLVLGGGAAIGYALATHPREGGMATPRGAKRLAVALVTGLACGLAGLGLGLTGFHMGAMSLDFLARSFPGSLVGLGPLARLLGEPSAGLRTCAVISTAEGLIFGLGLSLGLTRRPR